MDTDVRSDGSGQYDLVLQGGHVIDAKNGISGVADVAVRDGRIAAVGQGLSTTGAVRVIDVSGRYVTPGLIDMHVHVYPQHYDIRERGAWHSVVADGQSFSSGITTMVDAGSAGAANFGHLKEYVIDESRTRVLAYLNVVDLGMGGDYEQDTDRMDPRAAAAVASAYPDLIVGIKVAHYWTWQPYDTKHGPWTNVDRGVEAGVLCDKPLMVDFWPRPERPYEDLILKKLRPGDIHTHVFAQQFPIVDSEGRPNPALFEAQERGVIFDVGHGGGSFWFRNAVPAIAGGFLPNSISTDLHTSNAATGLVTNILNVMSKLFNIGVSLDDLIAKATWAPACEIGHPELGSLDVGAEADVAVLDVVEGPCAFIDCGCARMAGDKKLACALTLRAGQVAYDPEGLSMPDWREAPASYWVCKPPTGAPR